MPTACLAVPMEDGVDDGFVDLLMHTSVRVTKVDAIFFLNANAFAETDDDVCNIVYQLLLAMMDGCILIPDGIHPSRCILKCIGVLLVLLQWEFD